MSKLRFFNAITVSMLVVSLILVALVLVTVKTLDRRVIEAAAARNRHAEFLLAASVVSRSLERPQEIRNSTSLKRILSNIQQLRPGIRELEVFEFIAESAKPIILAGRDHPGKELSVAEMQAIRSNTVLSTFEGAGDDRAWIFTVPIASGQSVVGALRGRFSVSKYDQLIMAQEQVAKQVAIGAVIITTLTMLILIRIQLHRPMARLLQTMEEVRSGNLALAAPVQGPLEIRRLAENFNQMMAQLNGAMNEKEKLVHEIRAWNEKLESRVADTVQQLEKEKDKVTAAQLAAQRHSNLAALGEMSAIMAHEFGNPLNAMYGRVQLLENVQMSEECGRHLTVIKSQILRMSEVMKHILTSTRVEKEPSPIQLNDVILEVLDLLQASSVKVATELGKDLPPVAVNKTALHGVILNLVNNAVQAVNENGNIRITTRTVQQLQIDGHLLVQSVSCTSPMVRFIIEDCGVGIREDIVENLCEPFFTTRQEEGGTGLGLAICRRVVASAGGQLGVKSSVGNGTTFTVDFPVWIDKD